MSPRLAPGALIASLAIPWGFSKGDKDQGGYHLVWSRDMVETAGGLLAAGAHEDARRVLVIFADDPAAGRPLVAEYVVGWLALLERNPNGRDGVADSSGGPGPSREGIGRRRCDTVLADGEKSGGLIWRATARSARRIAGRKIPAIHRSRSRRKLPRCWRRRIWPI